ncbi:complexin-3-like [Coregonus clupeaformis]|uniref:complexin-3-like n=1 Tax=Coregonus clupeaformis TaxID=59861 RepID=UPI001E1C55D9|nr:complexin-3-like [Coregonus clupeaformis]XP_041708793.2 complexin-3-like [Coregonus clupeaformis]
MDTMVKQSLAVPMKKLSSCVTGVKEREVWARRRAKRWTGGVKSTPPRMGHTYVIRSYQTDLEKERKLREALNAQKHAERAAMRDHFRNKYQLSKSSKDTSHLSAVREKVALPRQLTKLIRPETPTKDDGYSLLSAFQGLSFNMGMLGGKQSKSPTPMSVNGEACKVM